MKKDIFDKMMELPGLRVFEPFYQKHREGLLYLFFGGLTTLVNLVLSVFFWYVLKWETWLIGDFEIGIFLGNLISIVTSIVFAYVTNRHWVFRSQVRGAKGILIEFAKFAGGRVSTLLIELGGVQLAVMLFPGDSVVLFISKLITQVIVILLNFVLSKVFVFRRKNEDAGQKDATDQS